MVQSTCYKEVPRVKARNNRTSRQNFEQMHGEAEMNSGIGTTSGPVTGKTPYSLRSESDPVNQEAHFQSDFREIGLANSIRACMLGALAFTLYVALDFAEKSFDPSQSRWRILCVAAFLLVGIAIYTNRPYFRRNYCLTLSIVLVSAIIGTALLGQVADDASRIAIRTANAEMIILIFLYGFMRFPRYLALLLGIVATIVTYIAAVHAGSDLVALHASVVSLVIANFAGYSILVGIEERERRLMESARFEFARGNQSKAIINRLAHDLRGMLSAIGTLLSETRHKLSESKYVEERRQITDSVTAIRQAAGYLEYLLRASAGASRESVVAIEDTTLVSMIQALVSSSSATANRRGVRLEVKLVQPERAVYMMTNHMVLWATLYNLLDNAIKFSAVSNTNALVRVSIEIDEKSTIIEIADNGPGMAVKCDRVGRLTGQNEESEGAERFARVDGMGFGLEMCAREFNGLVGHGIYVKSSDRSGTKIQLRIPVRPIESRQADASTAETVNSFVGTARNRPIEVLLFRVMDRTGVLADALKERMDVGGVTLVSSQGELKRCISNSDVVFDVLLVDSGVYLQDLQLARRTLSREQGFDIPVAICAANSTQVKRGRVEMWAKHDFTTIDLDDRMDLTKKISALASCSIERQASISAQE